MLIQFCFYSNYAHDFLLTFELLRKENGHQVLLVLINFYLMAVSKIPSCLLSYNLYSINKIEKGEKQIWWVIQTTSKQTEKATTSHAGIKDSKKKNQNQNISKKHAYID